jgi:uncharacterized protein YegP (UPF0339 family)
MSAQRFWFGLFLASTITGLTVAADKKMTFETYTDAKHEYRWRLKDGDGDIIATSGQGYAAKADCTKMVDNLVKDVSKYTFDVYEDNAKKFRFRIKASNGQVVGSSNTGYDKKADAEKVVDAIKKGAKDAEKVDDTKGKKK